MKNKLLIILMIVFVLGVGIFLTDRYKSTKHLNHETKKEVKAEKYICPMHPQITSEKPGTCPICGMDLVLVTGDDESEEQAQHSHEDNHKGHDKIEKKLNPTVQPPSGRTSVKLSLNKQQMIGVKVQTVREKKLFKSIKAPGRIAFDPELYTAQSEYLEALNQWKRVKSSPILDVRENTKQMIRSSKIRLKVLGLSNDQIDSLAKKGFQSEGLLVGGQDNVVYADIFEVDLQYIKEGQSAQISANFLQGRSLPGKVVSVDQVINPETRTAKVRIKLLKKDSAIRPESYVNVNIFAPLGEHVAVPLESIMDTGVDTYVFLKKEEGIFQPKKIQVILETDQDVAIVGDIKPGDEVVVGANFLIDSESRLKAVIKDDEAVTSGGHNH